MLDQHIVPILKAPLRRLAKHLHRLGVSANLVTVLGFFIGVLAVVALALGFFVIALVLLLLNRLADGVDGEIARLGDPDDAGAFLDIVLDFIFYALFPLGFAVYDPESNALMAAILVASFVGTGASFLAFDTFARQRSIAHPDFSYKGLYYLNGLAEGTETIIAFVLMCLLPSYFVWIAGMNRIVFSFTTLRRRGV